MKQEHTDDDRMSNIDYISGKARSEVSASMYSDEEDDVEETDESSSAYRGRSNVKRESSGDDE